MSTRDGQLPAPIVARGVERVTARQTAAWTRSINHPNIVEVAGVAETDDETTVEFVQISGERLSDVGDKLSFKQLTVALASTAQTLDDLHRRGVVHGAISAPSLIHTQSGRVVVSGLVEPSNRLLHTTPDDDTSALIETARLLISAGGREDGGASGWPRNTKKIDSQLCKLLLSTDLPTCAELAGIFSAMSRTSHESPHTLGRPVLRQYNKQKLILAVFLAGVAFFVTAYRQPNNPSPISARIPVDPNGNFQLNQQRFNLSETTSIVYRGRFNCSASDQLVVFRPQEHTVWKFDDPAARREQTGDFLGEYPSANDLEITSDGLCDRLFAVGRRYRKEITQ